MAADRRSLAGVLLGLNARFALRREIDIPGARRKLLAHELLITLEVTADNRCLLALTAKAQGVQVIEPRSTERFTICFWKLRRGKHLYGGWTRQPHGADTR